MFRIILVLLLPTTVFGQSINSAHFPQSFQTDVIHAVVQIQDQTTGSAGSGSAVGLTADGEVLILTGNHVIEDAKGEIFICCFPFDAQSGTGQVTVLAQDEKSDLALLAMRPPHPQQMLHVIDRSQTVARSTPILAVGFPARVLTCHESILIDQTRFQSLEYGVDAQFLRIADQAAPGISGAPIVVRVGDQPLVLGAWWGTANGEGRASAPSELHEFLDANGYSYVYQIAPDKHQEYLVRKDDRKQRPRNRLLTLFSQLSVELNYIQSENH